MYTIYQTTNLVNGKIYIGKHVTEDLNDGYIGSGKNLKRAIEKYGLESFSKDILFVFDNEAEMNAKEKELVTEEFCRLNSNYNLCPGGEGGFGYINSNLDLTQRNKKILANRTYWPKMSNERKIETGERLSSWWSKTKDEDPKKYAKILSRRNSFKKSENWKRIVSSKLTKENNPNFGKIWIKNEDLKLKKMIVSTEFSDWELQGWIKGNNNSYVYLKI